MRIARNALRPIQFAIAYIAVFLWFIFTKLVSRRHGLDLETTHSYRCRRTTDPMHNSECDTEVSVKACNPLPLRF